MALEVSIYDAVFEEMTGKGIPKPAMQHGGRSLTGLIESQNGR